MGNVYCIGELLIDFICPDHGNTLLTATRFEKNAGGAPANVCVASAKTGVKTYFLGQVGTDSFGDFLAKTVGNYSVDTSLMKRGGNTTLAFVSLDESGERSFEFMRGSDGDYELPTNIANYITPNDVVHFGSATALLPGNLKDSYFSLLEIAKDNKAFISFDPNYRDLLITDHEQFTKDSLHFIANANLVKLSEEEALLITKTTELDEAIRNLPLAKDAILAITLGAKGTMVVRNGEKKIIESINISVVDTTGAGDCFIGTFIGQVANLNCISELDDEITRLNLVKYANVAAALTCTNFGAIDAIPTRESVLMNME